MTATLAIASWHRDAERAVVASVLLSADSYDRAELDVADFRDWKHQAIWSAFGRLRTAGEAIDPVTVDIALGERSAAVGGLVYLVEVAGDVSRLDVTSSNVESYARAVRDAALTRRIHEAVRGALSSGLEGEELLGACYAAVTSAESRARDDARIIGDVVADRAREIVRQAVARENGETIATGITTGLADLDWAMSGGLATGAITVLGGRPSHGKSALARSIADGASRAGYPVHMFSVEDNRDTVADRMIADYGGINLQRLRTLDLSREDVAGLVAAAGRIQDRTNWLVDDAAGVTSAQIAMRVRRHKRTHGTRLVVIDYLQLLEDPGGTRLEALNGALRGLLALARTEDVAILLLSQLTRAPAREGRPPELHDLRETGDIEQVARAVLFVWQWTLKGSDEPCAEVRVAKNKHGARDLKVPLFWDGPTATYRQRGLVP